MEIAFEQVNLLIDRGASCRAKNNVGDSCFHLLLRRFGVDGDVFGLYRPHRLLTELLVRIIRHGGDVFSINGEDLTPSHMARSGNYERSWREALSKCDYSWREVYEKSGTQCEELRNISVEDDIVENLSFTNWTYGPRWIAGQLTSSSSYGSRRRQWSSTTMRKLLVEMIQSGPDLFKQLGPPNMPTIAHLAGFFDADRGFRDALTVCGYDPKEVYSRSGVPWLELDGNIYQVLNDDSSPSNYGDDESLSDQDITTSTESTCSEPEAQMRNIWTIEWTSNDSYHEDNVMPNFQFPPQSEETWSMDFTSEREAWNERGEPSNIE